MKIMPPDVTMILDGSDVSTTFKPERLSLDLAAKVIRAVIDGKLLINYISKVSNSPTPLKWVEVHAGNQSGQYRMLFGVMSGIITNLLAVITPKRYVYNIDEDKESQASKIPSEHFGILTRRILPKREIKVETIYRITIGGEPVTMKHDLGPSKSGLLFPKMSACLISSKEEADKLRDKFEKYYHDEKKETKKPKRK